jgi:predicted RNase H-like nuclease (RuvC/YqgF family)
MSIREHKSYTQEVYRAVYTINNYINDLKIEKLQLKRQLNRLEYKETETSQRSETEIKKLEKEIEKLDKDLINIKGKLEI